MSRIKIKYFGPIKEGLQENEGWIDIKKVTIFTGNQGSGKSTVAKLISVISWIEKALVRGDLDLKSIAEKGAFEEHCTFQNIQDYFLPNSLIEYQGDSIDFTYQWGTVYVKLNSNSKYTLPKIMYVPADRNFLGAIFSIDSFRDLPRSLRTFSDEYRKALKEIKGSVELPINDVRFEYNPVLDIPAIGTDDYLIDLAFASSGFQSAVPLFLVTRALAENIKYRHNLNTHFPGGELTFQQEDRIRKQIQEIRENPNLSEAIKRLEIELISSKFENSYFLNIVEEPEQNLHPTSQRGILNSLLLFNNMLPNNKLVMTTHSPYLINYITLAIKAKMIFSEEIDPNIAVKVSEIVPISSILSSDDIMIYEMDNKGLVTTLPTYRGLPSDENVLNYELGEFNDLFSELVELERRKK